MESAKEKLLNETYLKFMVSLRILLISCICSLPFAPLGAQVADSLDLRQVDSLNALCESLITAGNLEEALQINEIALQQATLHPRADQF
jgi:hypothetical protein